MQPAELRREFPFRIGVAFAGAGCAVADPLQRNHLRRSGLLASDLGAERNSGKPRCAAAQYGDDLRGGRGVARPRRDFRTPRASGKRPYVRGGDHFPARGMRTLETSVLRLEKALESVILNAFSFWRFPSKSKLLAIVKKIICFDTRALTDFPYIYILHINWTKVDKCRLFIL